jgi:hypothetical protein
MIQKQQTTKKKYGKQDKNNIKTSIQQLLLLLTKQIRLTPVQVIVLMMKLFNLEIMKLELIFKQMGPQFTMLLQNMMLEV